MKKALPSYSVSFSSRFSFEDTLKVVCNIASDPVNRLKLMNTYSPDMTHIVLLKKNDGLISYNSFLPIICIDLKTSTEKVDVSIVFQLKKQTRWMYIILNMFLLLFGIVMLFKFGFLAFRQVLIIPIAMMFILYILCYSGLYFSSKSIMKTFTESLSQ